MMTCEEAKEFIKIAKEERRVEQKNLIDSFVDTLEKTLKINIKNKINQLFFDIPSKITDDDFVIDRLEKLGYFVYDNYNHDGYKYCLELFERVSFYDR